VAKVLDRNAKYRRVADGNGDLPHKFQPQTLIFGPADFGWAGYVRLSNASNAHDRDFQEFYLKGFADAEKSTGP
jgi:hypothetical protein